MRAHDLGFFRRMRTRLVEDGIRYADLADVVQRRGVVQEFAGFFGEAVQLTEHPRDDPDTPDMIRRFL